MDTRKALCFSFIYMFTQSYPENMEGAKRILVIPDLSNQWWYSQFCNMITKDVFHPPKQDLLLLLTDQNISHPLHQN